MMRRRRGRAGAPTPRARVGLALAMLVVAVLVAGLPMLGAAMGDPWASTTTVVAASVAGALVVIALVDLGIALVASVRARRAVADVTVGRVRRHPARGRRARP